MTAIVTLTQGKVALVDDADWTLVTRHRWHASRKKSGGWYARRGKPAILMHRVIMGLVATDVRRVDHVNGNGLDNRRANLRLATHVQNMQNTGVRADSTSGLKGVVRKSPTRWQARIYVNRVRLHLGSFASPKQAAEAYDRAALEHFGEFAKLNYPAQP